MTSPGLGWWPIAPVWRTRNGKPHFGVPEFPRFPSEGGTWFAPNRGTALHLTVWHRPEVEHHRQNAGYSRYPELSDVRRQRGPASAVDDWCPFRLADGFGDDRARLWEPLTPDISP